MVQAYSVLANDGVQNTQLALLKIKDNKNNVLFEAKPEQKKIFDSKYVRVLNSVLSDDASRVPTFQANGPLTVPGYQVAAKTGTSQDYRDAWTLGFSPTLAAGVWVGNNDYSEMKREAAGGMAAAPIWNDFMKQALPKFPKEDFFQAETLSSQKPMLDGSYVIQTETGPQVHDILFWIDKKNPLGPQPQNPENDPQFSNWEAGVKLWLTQNILSNNPSTQIYSQIFLLDPQDSSLVRSGESLKISAKISSITRLSRVEFYFNNKPVIVFEPTADNFYSVFFMPSQVLMRNEIYIRAVEESGRVMELRKEFSGV